MNYSKPIPSGEAEFEAGPGQPDARKQKRSTGLWQLVVGVLLMVISLILVALAVWLAFTNGGDELPAATTLINSTASTTHISAHS